MRRALLALLTLIALAAFAAAPAHAASVTAISIDASQSYLRLGQNDTVTVMVQLWDEGQPAAAADVPVVLNFRSGEDYVVFGNQMIITNASGEGTATIFLNASNQPERSKLFSDPLQVMVEAVVASDQSVRGVTSVYITDTGPITGFVLDDSQSTITGATITVVTPDGHPFPGGPYVSSDGSGSPMGSYRIDNLPVGVGRFTLVAEKNGYTGTRQAEAGFEDRQDIVIPGYVSTVDIGPIVSSANVTPTPTPAPVNSTDTSAQPTSTTTTILIAIVLITLVYIGLKAYRKMF